jgi:hypothetical protein
VEAPTLPQQALCLSLDGKEQEIVMSKTAPKKKANTGFIPRLPILWDLTAISQGYGTPLSELNRLKISHQDEGESPQTILGSIRTAPPEVTSYAIEDGEVAFEAGTNQLQMFFTVTIHGTVYTFTGNLDGDTLVTRGTITPGPPPPNPIFEDGNWSAQAQGGGEEEKGRRHKPARRTSR